MKSKQDKQIGIDVLELAKFMHNAYEEQSKLMGWNTQKDCKVEFEMLPTNNKNTMVRVSALVIDWINKNQEDLGILHKFKCQQGIKTNKGVDKNGK